MEVQKVGPDVCYSLKERGGFVDWYSESQEYFALINRISFTPRMEEVAEKERVIQIGLADMLQAYSLCRKLVTVIYCT